MDKRLGLCKKGFGGGKGKAVLIAIALGLGAMVFVLWLWGIGRSAWAAPTVERQVCPSGCAYDSIQAAVDDASAGDVIKVAQGRYTDVHYRGSVTQVAYVSASVAIRGGYTTANGFADPPDPVAYPTVLDAGRQGRAIYVTQDVTVTLTGLRLVGGDGSGLGGGTGTYADAGGGFYVDQEATVTISDCVIAANRSPMAGGGYAGRRANFTLQNSLITANVAISGSGGGIYLYDPAQATIDQNTIISNAAGFNAGGLQVVYGISAPVICHNTIVSNVAAHDGGGIFMASGAVLRGNEVAHNQAAASGGGVYINGRSPVITANRVFDNRAVNYGGGIYVMHDALLQGNTIISNTGGLGGGGLLIYDSQGRLENNIVAHNRIGAGRDGAGIYLWAGAPQVLHTTLAENVGGDGSGLHVRDLLGDPGAPVLTNTIIVSHAVGVQVASGSTVTLEATLWGSGTWANGTDAIGLVISSTNVSGDPGFVAPGAWDYHIGPTSDAIDAGVGCGVGMDIDAQSRPAGAAYDIGADEFWLRLFLPLVMRQS